MYILVKYRSMEIPREIQRTILMNDVVKCALGEMPLAIELLGGLGVLPRESLRIYGSYATVLITRGSGFYRDANGVSQSVTAGDMIFVFPEIAHVYGTHSDSTWDELYFIFRGPVFDAWRTMGIIDQTRPVVSTGAISRVEQRMKEIAVDEGADSADGKSHQICRFLSLLTEILGDPSTRRSQTAGVSGSSGWLSRVCALLSSDLESHATIDDFASKVGMSSESFRKRFKSELGISPMRFRNQKRIEAACHLLLYTTMTHAHIAQKLAFSDEFHLSKRFKQIQGISPSEFRLKSAR